MYNMTERNNVFFKIKAEINIIAKIVHEIEICYQICYHEIETLFNKTSKAIEPYLSILEL